MGGSSSYDLSATNVTGLAEIRNNFFGVDQYDIMNGDGVTGSAIYFTGSADALIHDNHIAGSTITTAISVYAAGDVSVNGNRINIKESDGSAFGTLYAGIDFHSEAPADNSNVSQIWGNSIGFPSNVGILFQGNNLSGEDQAGISLNNIKSSAADGIRLIEYGDGLLESGITQNTITDAGNNGIWVIGGFPDGPFISNNTVSNSGNLGIFSDAGGIANNTVSDSGSSGIQLTGTGDIYENTVSGSGNVGIVATFTQNAVIRDNVLSNNAYCGIEFYSTVAEVSVYNNTATSNACGIYGSSTSKSSVHDNTVSLSTQYGINLNGFGDVYSNVSHDNAGHGIVIHATGLSNVYSNTVYENGGDGISSTADAQIIIHDNTVYSNDSIGIISGNVGQTAIYKNTLYGNGQVGVSYSEPNVEPLNAPVVRSQETNEFGTAVTFTTTLPDGDYRFDLCYNPSGVDPSGYGECEEWKVDYETEVTSNPQAFIISLPGDGYDVTKFSMQVSHITGDGEFYVSASSELGGYEDLPEPEPLTADLSNDVHSETYNGPVTRVGVGQIFGGFGPRVFSEVCNAGESVITSFKISKVTTGLTNTSYTLHQDSIGSIDSNGVWTGQMPIGNCLFLDYNFTVSGAVGTDATWSSTISEIKDENGDPIEDIQSSNNSDTITALIDDLPDIKVNSRLLTTGAIVADTPVSYAISIQNVGAGPSLGGMVGISFLLPEGATFDGVQLDPDRPADGVTLAQCESLGLANEMGSPGLADYRGEIIQCVFNVPGAFAPGQILPFTFNMTSSTTFENGSARAIAVGMAFDEPDTINFINTFSSGGDGFGILNEDGSHLNNISWLDYDSDPLTVTINRCPGLGEVTEIDDACFSVVFNKPIYAPSFTIDDLVLTGGGTVYSFMQVSDTEWTVRITGMTHGGTLTLSLGAGSVVDYSAIPNTQVLGENIIRFGTVASGETTDTNGSAQAASKTPRGSLAETGSDYDWYSPVIIMLSGWALILIANSRRRRA